MIDKRGKKYWERGGAYDSAKADIFQADLGRRVQPT